VLDARGDQRGVLGAAAFPDFPHRGGGADRVEHGDEHLALASPSSYVGPESALHLGQGVTVVLGEPFVEVHDPQVEIAEHFGYGDCLRLEVEVEGGSPQPGAPGDVGHVDLRQWRVVQQRVEGGEQLAAPFVAGPGTRPVPSRSFGASHHERA
jgi:hypothetical protein